MTNESVDDTGSNGRERLASSTKGDSNRFSLSRRSYLKAAGAAAVAVGATGATSAVDGYEIVEVDAGDTYSVSLGDGDTLENVLIDITADGAGYSIDADGSGWAIRNVGVRGLWDHSPGSSPLTVEVPESSGSAVIENVYLPGAEDYQMGDPTGIYVFPEHAGTLEIRNVYVAQFGDNGIYASAPGNPDSHPVPGAHGSVQVYDSYVTRCRTNVRLGTDSSLAQNVVSTDPVGGKSAFRDYYGLGVTFRNCDAYSPGAQCFKSGSSTWNGSRGVSCGPGPSLENCRAEGDSITSGPCPTNGSPNSNPRTDPPAGVPLSAEAAASGGASSGDAQLEATTVEDVWSADGSNQIVLEAASDAGIVEYRIDGTGVADYGEDANTGEDDEYRDTITGESDDFVVKGYLSGGGTDSFQLEGAVSAVEIDGDVAAIVNGTEFDPVALEGVGNWSGSSDNSSTNDSTTDDSTTDDSSTNDGSTDDSSTDDSSSDDSSIDNGDLPNSIVIDGSNAPEDFSRYKFTVSGDVAKSDELTSVGGDTHGWDALESVISDGEVIGVVENGRDGFRFTGNVTSIQIHGNATVEFENGN